MSTFPAAKNVLDKSKKTVILISVKKQFAMSRLERVEISLSKPFETFPFSFPSCLCVAFAGIRRGREYRAVEGMSIYVGIV